MHVISGVMESELSSDECLYPLDVHTKLLSQYIMYHKTDI